VAWLISLTAAAAAQQLVLDDSLKGGGTSGTRSGGSFQADGWRVTGKNDYIYWHIPTVSSGAVEFSVRGLRPNDTRPEGADKNEIFHMYDWTWNNADTSYAPGYRDDRFKHFIRKTNGDVGKIDSCEFVWAIDPNYVEPDSQILSWDQNATYRFREEWGSDGAGNSYLKCFRDGALILQTSIPGSWTPAGHAIRIGASPRAPGYPDFGACVDAVYSDLKVWSGGNGAPPPPPPQAGPVSVGVSGDKFTVNGQPKFLLGASYFDASNWRTSDIDDLAARRFNLIRIWLDWGTAGDGRSFFDASGALVQGSKLLSLVRYANNRGIVVDVTILDPGLTFSDVTRALREAATALKDESNVFFDVMNEHDHGGGPRTHAEVAGFVTTVRSNAPNRPITVSSTGGHLLDVTNINEEIDTGVNIITPHMPRTSDWFSQTAQRVAFVKNAIAARGRSMPVYFQEEARRNNSGLNNSKDEFLQAATAARDAGAAAWNFHTDAGFDLNVASFFNSLDPVELDTVNSLADAIYGPGGPGGGGGGGGAPSGNLKGEYFDNINLSGTRVERNDAAIDFDWSTGSPVAGIGPDTFSVRWTGLVKAPQSETVTFITESDDGVRLWVNGQLLVDNWTDHGVTENSGSIALQAGKYYAIQLEYYENTVGALIRLSWQSPSTPRQVIPASAFLPPAITALASGWESGEPQGLSDQVFIIREVSGFFNSSTPPPECSPRAGETWRSGSNALMVAGYSNAAYAYCYYKLFDENILILPGTHLRYWVWHVGSGKLAMDGHFTDGTDLRDSGFVDQNGVPFHPGKRTDPVGAWYYVDVDLSAAAGKVLDFLLVGFDNGNDGYIGQYRAYIDDFAIGVAGSNPGPSPTPAPTPTPAPAPSPTPTPAPTPTPTPEAPGGSGWTGGGSGGGGGCGLTGAETLLLLIALPILRRRRRS
jgi:hypothetical protein